MHDVYRGHQCVCLTHTAHLTDLPYTLCTSWELPSVQWDNNNKKKKTTFHTHRQTCTNVFPSVELLDLPEDHKRKKKHKTKKQKVQKAEWEMLIRGVTDSEIGAGVTAGPVCNDLHIFTNLSMIREVAWFFFLQCFKIRDSDHLDRSAGKIDDFFSASWAFSQKCSLSGSNEQT